MNKLRNYLLVAIALGLVVIVLAFASHGSRVALAAGPDREPIPFQSSFNCSGNGTCTADLDEPIPAGKRLIIQYVSASGSSGTLNSPDLDLWLKCGGKYFRIIPATVVQRNNLTIGLVAQQMVAFAGSENPPQVTITVGIPSTGVVTGVVTGYLEANQVSKEVSYANEMVQ